MFKPLQQRIQYKIIVPFLLLTFLVAVTGSASALLFVTGNAQERLNNQLAQVARAGNDTIVRIETANLAFLREVALAGANPTGAPAIAEALATNNQIATALDPYFRVSLARNLRVDRLIAFDQNGTSVIDWQRPTNATTAQDRIERQAQNLSNLWFVKAILAGQSDKRGDKYAGLVAFESDDQYLYTVAPITYQNQIVGGLIAAIHLNSLLRDLSNSSLAAIVTIYDPANGQAFSSTAASTTNLASLNVRTNLLPLLNELNTTADQQAILDTIEVNQRTYQAAYTPLQIRGAIVGYLSVSLASDYVIGPWSDLRTPLLAVTIILMTMIIVLGVRVARQITRPLEELVSTAQAVTAGHLDRRSQVTTHDEVGLLSRSFNSMTSHLLKLYRTMHAEASQRAAVFESIPDGIVMTDCQGKVLIINSAMRLMLRLEPNDPPPPSIQQFQLRSVEPGVLSFGDHATPDLYYLGDQIVRAYEAPVRTEQGQLLGYVFVLHDLTSAVAIDQAKTNFIATISHELRTPLTVIGGNTELLLKGIVGQLTDDQHMLMSSIRTYTTTMTGLINNVIVIAGLDSGSYTFEFESLPVAAMLQEPLRSIQRMVKNKNLNLHVDLPEHVPPVLVDAQHIQTVFQQVLNNACCYTKQGSIVIRASYHQQVVQIDISDTGPGIEPALHDQLFQRFTRGSQGINSAERGIGLGLAIAHELLEQQHGRIWLAETSSLGSTFSIQLPISHDNVATTSTKLNRVA